jgi:hypothetical protein
MTVILLVILLIGGLLGVGLKQKRHRRLRVASQNLLITYVVVLVILAGGELYLRYVYSDSGMVFTLSRNNWSRQFIHKNSLGFRDREWTMDELRQKTTIFVVGDSFTQGWGIDAPEDRYSDVLAAMLGDEYAVVNLAHSGDAPRDELQTLKDYPYHAPDVVIWQYYLNDVDLAARENGMPWEPQLPTMPPVIGESYLASFLYSRLNAPKVFVNIHDGRTEWEYRYAAYDTPQVWESHTKELDAMLVYLNGLDTRLIVLIYPNMVNPVESSPYVQRVAEYLQSQGCKEILTLDAEASKWTLGERIISTRDPHASVAFNHTVGEMLYHAFFTDNL